MILQVEGTGKSFAINGDVLDTHEMSDSYTFHAKTSYYYN